MLDKVFNKKLFATIILILIINTLSFKDVYTSQEIIPKNITNLIAAFLKYEKHKLIKPIMHKVSGKVTSYSFSTNEDWSTYEEMSFNDTHSSKNFRLATYIPSYLYYIASKLPANIEDKVKDSLLLLVPTLCMLGILGLIVIYPLKKLYPDILEHPLKYLFKKVIIDGATGKTILSLPYTNNVLISPDEKVCLEEPLHSTGHINLNIYSLPNGKLLSTIPYRSSLQFFYENRFTPDSKFLLIKSYLKFNKLIRLYSTATGTLEKALIFPKNFGNYIFNPYTHDLIATHNNEEDKIFLYTLKDTYGFENKNYIVKMTPYLSVNLPADIITELFDNTRFINQTQCIIRKLSKDSAILTKKFAKIDFERHTCSIINIPNDALAHSNNLTTYIRPAQHPDNKGKLAICSTNSKKCIRMLSIKDKEIDDIWQTLFSENDNWLLTYSNQHLSLWDTTLWRQVYSIDQPNGIDHAGFCAESNNIFTFLHDGTLHIYDFYEPLKEVLNLNQSITFPRFKNLIGLSAILNIYKEQCNQQVHIKDEKLTKILDTQHLTSRQKQLLHETVDDKCIPKKLKITPY